MASGTLPRNPVWIMADHQTNGRGRRGRPWSSPGGALCATLLLYPDEPATVAALRSFVISLALADAFTNVGVAPGAVSLKWPNDVLLYQCKAAGILLESSGQAQALEYLAIGVGINLDGLPSIENMEPDALAPISVAHVLGRSVDPDDMLSALARAYADWEDRFVAGGFSPIRDAWLARAARIGEPIRARTQRQTFHGTFDTVDEAGNLILTTADGRVSISAADVFF